MTTPSPEERATSPAAYKQTHCKRGHSLDDAYLRTITRERVNGGPKIYTVRRCRICHSEWIHDHGNRKKRHWRKYWDGQLIELWPSSPSQIAEILGTSEAIVVRRAKRLGLIKKQKWSPGRTLTHFGCGHEITRDNTYFSAASPNGRCWTCKREQGLRYFKAKQAPAISNQR